MTHVEPVPYATPASRSNSRVWAGGLIVLAGLGLIALGGCFLIGVLLIVNDAVGGGAFAPSTPKLTRGEMILTLVLYGLAFVSFAGAALLLFTGIRGLLHALRG